MFSPLLRGSSPLTRGKHIRVHHIHPEDGLIPAHAGKTSAVGRYPRSRAAHPRSRGENFGGGQVPALAGGSSPLTRGKLGQRDLIDPEAGLIPAHAGKTDAQVSNDHATKAHPRSRGENRQKTLSLSATLGSYPLTRGKQRRRPRRPQRTGLIPAHAGKTTECSPGSRIRRAHPRSRGENIDGFINGIKSAGSSPLTRGKPVDHEFTSVTHGLIPAHAGKTDETTRSISCLRAHPRSRGENRGGGGRHRHVCGSSPLTRGKLARTGQVRRAPGLIPAHAGKTWCRSLRY